MTTVTSHAAERAKQEGRWYPPAQGQWTYDDFVHLPKDGYRYEIIEGVLHMSPAPRPRHQIAAGRLYSQLDQFVRARGGIAIPAPVDVRFDQDSNVVEPDVVVIEKANRAILKENFIDGVPDVLVEVLSPSSSDYDLKTKLRLYLAKRVREYWIVDPVEEWVLVRPLRDDLYVAMDKAHRGDTAYSEVLDGFEVAVDDIFAW